MALYLAFIGLALLDEVLLAKGLLDTVLLKGALIPSDDGGVLLAHFSIDSHSEAPNQGGSDGDISHGDLVTVDEPGAALQVSFEASKGTLQALQSLGLSGSIVGDKLDAPQSQLLDGVKDFALSEADPLANGGAGGGGGTGQLGGGGATLSDKLSDGVGLEDGGAVSSLEGRDFAQGKLGDEIGGLVGHTHGELGDGEFQAIDVSSRLGLRAGVSMYEVWIYGH